MLNALSLLFTSLPPFLPFLSRWQELVKAGAVDGESGGSLRLATEFCHRTREREGEDREDMIELGTEKVRKKRQREEEMHWRKELMCDGSFPSHAREKG